MRGQMQCMAVDGNGDAEGMPNVDLYPYMAFGGDSPTYDVTMTMEGEDDMVMDVAHQFMITMNDMDIAELSGQPNTAAGIHNWILNARDSTSDQHVSRSWMLQVVQETYTAPNDPHTLNEAEPMPTDATMEWADFISSNHDGGFNLGENAIGGSGVVLNLKNDFDASNDPPTPGAGTVEGGKIDPAVDDVADVDVFWVGPLTPNSVLSVKVAGTYEAANSPGIFNPVTVTLHSFVSGGEKSPAEMAGESKMEGYDEYKEVDCGNYYLEVSGEEGTYELSWTFTE